MLRPAAGKTCVSSISKCARQSQTLKNSTSRRGLLSPVRSQSRRIGRPAQDQPLAMMRPKRFVALHLYLPRVEATLC